MELGYTRNKAEDHVKRPLMPWCYSRYYTPKARVWNGSPKDGTQGSPHPSSCHYHQEIIELDSLRAAPGGASAACPSSDTNPEGLAEKIFRV